MRSSALLRLVIPAFAVAVIAGAAWIAVSGTLSPERLKSEMQRAARPATGRTLTIAGPVRISLGLAPRISAENLALANPPGFPAPQMAVADKVTAQLALIPLLTGQLVFKSIDIDGADVTLQRGPDGTPNWQFPKPRRALYQPAAPGPAPAAEPEDDDTEIQDIHLTGGHIACQPAAGPPTTISIATAELTVDNDSGPMKLTAQANAGGLDLAINLVTGSFGRLRGGAASALAGAWPVTLDVSGAGALLHVDGGITHPDQMRTYTFNITANAPLLSALQPLVPQYTLPPIKEVNFTTRLSDGSTGELRSAGLSVHAGLSDLSALVPGLIVKEASISAPGPGQLAQFVVNGTYQSTPLSIAGTAAQPDFNGAEQPVPIAFTAQIASATASVRGSIPPGLGENGLDLTISGKIPDLTELSALAGRTLPPAKDVNFDTKLGDAGFRLRGIALREMNITSSLADLNGALTIAWSPSLDLQGNLQSKSLDLDALGLASLITVPQISLPMAQPMAEPAQPSGLVPDLALPLAALRGANADLTLSLASVVLGGETLRDFQARLQASNGKISLNPFRVTAPEGVVIGGASIDAGSDRPPGAVSLRAPALASAPLAAALGYPGAASGPVQVDAQLSFIGASTGAWLKSLTGHVGISMVHGQVSDSLVSALLGGALPAGDLPDIGGGTSDVRCFALRTDLHDGRGTLQALALDTSRLSMSGTGAFDLADETLNLHLRPSLMVGPASAAAPVTVTGRFGAPKIALDPVMGGGRVGFTLGGAPSSGCPAALRLARSGMPGPMPDAAQPDAAAPARKIRKPVDLLRGLLHQ
jgi:uncharacterized protein involved in outer membrane biogenesis